MIHGFKDSKEKEERGEVAVESDARDTHVHENGIDHRRTSGCRQDAVKLDEMIKQFISVLTYLTELVLFLPKTFVVEVILVETNKRIKGPDPDFR